MSQLSGKCLCGGIQIDIPKPKEDGTVLCHCADCRRASGATSSANIVVPNGDIKVVGSKQPKRFDHTGSSGKAVRRFFCDTCGSPIWTEADLVDGMAFVRAGLFNPGDIPKPSTHLFGKNMEQWEKPIHGAEVKDTE